MTDQQQKFFLLFFFFVVLVSTLCLYFCNNKILFSRPFYLIFYFPFVLNRWASGEKILYLDYLFDLHSCLSPMRILTDRTIKTNENKKITYWSRQWWQISAYISRLSFNFNFLVYHLFQKNFSWLNIDSDQQIRSMLLYCCPTIIKGRTTEQLLLL